MTCYEEFHPPSALHRGNVGTPNSDYVRLLRSDVLTDTICKKIQDRAPLLWSWANPLPIPCQHRLVVLNYIDELHYISYLNCSAMFLFRGI